MTACGPKVVARVNAHGLANCHGGTLANIPQTWFQQWAEVGLGGILLDGLFVGPGPGGMEGGGASAFLPDKEIGGVDGLALFRRKANTVGLKTYGAFNGNHIQKSNPLPFLSPSWLMEVTDPGLKVGDGVTELDLGEGRSQVFYEGRDPNFPPVQGTLQLNTAHPGLRGYLGSVFGRMATYLDGIYCSQAMLILGEVLQKTWGDRIQGSLPGGRESASPWPQFLESAKDVNPDFQAMAEVYWGLEWALMQEGFGHCLDQRMVDRIENGDMPGLWDHLSASWDYLGKTLHVWKGRSPFADEKFTTDEKVRFVLFLLSPGLKIIDLPPTLGEWPAEKEPQSWDHGADLIQIARPLAAGLAFHLHERPGKQPDGRHAALVFSWQGKDLEQGGKQVGTLVVANGSGELATGFVKWDGLGSSPGLNAAQWGDGSGLVNEGGSFQVAPDGIRYHLAGQGCLVFQAN